MGVIGSITEEVKCPKCKNIINAKIISEDLGTPSIKGVKVFKAVKLVSHKKDGFFSLKCPESGTILRLSIWHPSNNVKKSRCGHCKQKVSAFIIKQYSKRDERYRAYTKETTITVLKLLNHSRVTHHKNRLGNFRLQKCSGTGKIVKEKNVNLIDNCHP